MKCIIIFILVISSLFIVSCTQVSPNQSSIETAIAQTEVAKPFTTSIPSDTPSLAKPTKTNTPTDKPKPSSTFTPFANLTKEQIGTTEERIEFLWLFFYAMVEDVQDAKTLRKYLNTLDIGIENDTLTYSSWADINKDESIDLAWDLLYWGAVVSTQGKSGNWNLDRIEFINYGPLKSSVTYYIEGNDTMVSLADNPSLMLDIMEVDVDMGLYESPTP